MAKETPGLATAAAERLAALGNATYVRLHTGEPGARADDSGPPWTPWSAGGCVIAFPDPGPVLRSGESLVITRETTAEEG